LDELAFHYLMEESNHGRFEANLEGEGERGYLEGDGAI
jgi:hypothetical protein